MFSGVEPSFWRGKKVLLTGHTGFKGSWLSMWLASMGAEVHGLALDPETKPSLFELASVNKVVNSRIGDIRNLSLVKEYFSSVDPDILIHMAAQPLVRLSYEKPIETYEVNVMGTLNVLEAARLCSNLKAIVNVTTDKCYENREWPWGYREIEPMGGHDPYSNSKGCVELITSCYQNSFFFKESSPGLASARAGNVIGGGDWATDRLIPDILRAFEAGLPVVIRNPLATRPWQHVLEPLSGYLLLAQNLFVAKDQFSCGWNFGPSDEDALPVSQILDKMIDSWGDGAAWQLDNGDHPHEAKFLKLDISKARQELNWSPTWSISTSLQKIVMFHKAYMSGRNVNELCMTEISDYMSDSKLLKIDE